MTTQTIKSNDELKRISNIAEQLAAIGNMTVGELREKYREVFGEPTRSRNKDYLRKHVAWRIQELAEGGLSKRALARIEELADSNVELETWRRRKVGNTFPQASGLKPKTCRDSRLPAVGTVITRKYKGVEHLVTIRDDGFEYKGKLYSSLSHIARVITLCQWNGFLFFGLQKRNADKETE